MPPRTDDDIYDEVFNDDEQKILEAETPPSDPAAPAPDGGAVDPAAPTDPADPALADPAAGDDKGGAPATDDELKDFLSKHKDKSPEELATLLYQQHKRADRANFSARNSQKAIEDMRARAQERLNARKAEIADEKKKFAETLEADPDAAARLLADRAFAEEERAAQEEAEQVEREARFDEAIGFAGKYIPDFAKTAPAMQSFGMEMGFTPEEVAGIDDGRQLVVLYLANLAGNMLKAGAIDIRGNLRTTQPVAEEPSDPRLRQPAAPTTAGSGGGQPAAPTPLDKQAAAMLQMSEEDFAKLSDADLEKVFGG